jgi:hypothetical protein
MKQQFYINLLLTNSLFSFNFWKKKLIFKRYERGNQKTLRAALKYPFHHKTGLPGSIFYKETHN